MTCDESLYRQYLSGDDEGIISKNELTRYARKERIRRFFCKPENNRSL